MREERRMNRMNKLLNREEVCAILHIGKNTYYKLCKQPSFPVVHCGRKILIDADGLRDWIEQYKI